MQRGNAQGMAWPDAAWAKVAMDSTTQASFFMTRWSLDRDTTKSTAPQ